MQKKKRNRNAPYIEVDQITSIVAQKTNCKPNLYFFMLFLTILTTAVVLLVHDLQLVKQTISSPTHENGPQIQKERSKTKLKSNESSNITTNESNKVIEEVIYINGMRVGTLNIKQKINRNQSEQFYTQGLVFANDTTLIESGGMYESSSIHSIHINDASKVVVYQSMPREYFGEGCDIINGSIYQLTWREQIIFKYNLQNFSDSSRFNNPYQLIQGWGISHRVMNGQYQIFLTDGSDIIYWAHENFTIFNTTKISYPNNTQAINLNELEYANGLLYINIYLSSTILAVDIDTGLIKKFYDLDQLTSQVTQTRGYENFIPESGLCLNGIAYYSPNNREVLALFLGSGFKLTHYVSFVKITWFQLYIFVKKILKSVLFGIQFLNFQICMQQENLDPPKKMEAKVSQAGESENFSSYLTAVALSLLTVDRDLWNVAIHQDSNQQGIMNFLTDSTCKSLIVSKFTQEDDTVQINIRSEMDVQDNFAHSIAFIKRSNFEFTADTLPSGFTNLVQVMNIGYTESQSVSNPFTLTHSYVQNCFIPIFSNYKAEVEKKQIVDKQSYSELLKKLNEVNLAVLKCRQNVEVPEIILQFDPQVREICQRSKANNTKPSHEDIQQLNTPSLINQLSATVLKWINDIKLITEKAKFDLSTASVVDEINYWMSMERSMNFIDAQLKYPEVEYTIEALKQAKKFNITTQFEHDLSNFKVHLQKCINCNAFMKAFPINELLTASNMSELKQAIIQIFSHMKKLASVSDYLPQRSLQLVEALSRDLTVQITKLFKGQQIMFIKYCEFKITMANTSELFQTWEEEYKVLRQSLNKQKPSGGQRDQSQQLYGLYEHNKLYKRAEVVMKIRQIHENLKEVIESIVGSETTSSKGGKDIAGIFTTKEISEAYEVFQNLDVFDLSKDGEQALDNATRQYELAIDNVESTITTKLRDSLGCAQSSKEMFRIFGKFNKLFQRPRIKGAIQEYQTQLLKTVQKDIQMLQEKFKNKYQNSQNSILAKSRDIPFTAGYVIWAKQLQSKLKKYMAKVEQVLGSNWSEDPEGKKCKETGDTFDRILDVTKVTGDYFNELNQHKKVVGEQSEKLFEVVQKKKQLEIRVNTDEKLSPVFKELRNLKNMKVRINYSYTFVGEQVQENYPLTLSLQESLHTYMQISSQLNDRSSKLVAHLRRDVQKIIQSGFNYLWNHKAQIQPYVKKFSEKVLELETAVNGLNERIGQIEALCESMKTCSPEGTVLADKLKQVQEVIDDLSFKSFSNLHLWIQDLDNQIETILSERLSQQIKKWINQFENYDDVVERDLIEGPTFHELKIQDQLIYIDPPVEYAKYFWLQEFHKMLGTICCLPRLEANRYESNIIKRDGPWGSIKDNNYFGVLRRVQQDLVESTYKKINDVFYRVEEYVQTWLNYQSLWVLDSKQIEDSMGDDIERWQQMLTDIKQGRQTFDNSQTEQHFGTIVVDYRLVQVKINNKYDQWHKELLSYFGNTFGEKLRSFLKKISEERVKLQKINFLNLSSDIMEAISTMQSQDQHFTSWGIEMESFRSGQKVLDRQRFQYPTDWLSIDQLEQEWSNFKQLKAKKQKQMDTELANIQAKVSQDEKSLNQIIEDIERDWKDQRPDSGDLLPQQALEVLNRIDKNIHEVLDRYKKCCSAKDLLRMEPGNPQKLEILEEQVQGLLEMWVELNKVWKNVTELKELQLLTVKSQQIKNALEESQKQLNQVPNKLRSYEAYDKMRERLQQYIKMNRLIMELKTDAMKDRHWRQLLAKLKINESFSEVTLGHLWQAELMRYESFVRETMAIAQGEMVLEEMIRAVREYWNSFELELVKYQTKCKLIRGWDELFVKLEEDLNNLVSMKISPYYKAFEGEIVQWDDKLQKVKLTLDTWIDVQRRWVYLEGIFFGSSDIKTQLANEYNKFKSIDNEFTSLMKKVGQKPALMEVMSIQGLQKTLERLSDFLQKIQKALGDYLETQRQAFARFYFIGDDDLLDIIGNSKDVTNVQRHFPKMYAGIVSLLAIKEGNDDVVQGMCSREGEQVMFVKEVKIAEDPRINIWLAKVDQEMMNSLALELEKSVSAINSVAKNDQLKIIEIHPAQIILLALQVNWCHMVESAFTGQKTLNDVVEYVLAFLATLAESVLLDHPKQLRQKFEQIITDFVHQRDVTRQLIKTNITSRTEFGWQYHMRFNWNTREADVGKKLQIHMGNASFHYGFEYLGVAEKLVQTPLTDKCYLTLTQALHLRMGGSPFGPAGTGKTESVKALGAQLGRFVLVFNCDETFDFNAMGRIFVGLCQVGAWGCFDEFNRLEERMLSACSQQILVIQTGLREKQKKIELMQKEVSLSSQLGIFVTMNPGYAGRSNLPENLKQLFRQMAMVKPDRELIAQVMLYSQGFRTAERLAGKIVSLFELCADQLSSQPHYDFGLRALKSVLNSAGNMKRSEMVERDQKAVEQSELDEFERKILLRSVCDTVVPKLVQEDIPLLQTLLSGVFPGSKIPEIKEFKLREEMNKVCQKRNLLATPNFVEKVLQLFQIQRISHGLMLVGPCGCGKSAAWRVLLESLFRCDKIKGDHYIVDPKAINKDELYGRLDNTTLEWTDGVFTSILRKILANQRGESTRRHWIIFDGDVDPEWAENLNSVLDDNKLLTLPNGERLAIPPNVRLIFEVETLKYATLATVSRCGMVWFSEETISPSNTFYHFLERLKQEDYDEQKGEEDTSDNKKKPSAESHTRLLCVGALQPLFQGTNSVVLQVLELAQKPQYKHVMEFTRIRVLESTFALMRRAISNILEYNESHSEIPLDEEQIRSYMEKMALISLMWGVAGSLNLYQRTQFSQEISQIIPTSFILPSFSETAPSIIDFDVLLPDGEWQLWSKKVPQVEIDPQKVTDADLIIETVDTLRHKEVLCGWLSEHRPFLLCGPPGSGKTMTLMSTLKSLVDFEMIFVNFSSSTLPPLIIKQFDHYCEYVKTTSKVILRPKQPNKWLVVFCDEINLPDQDKYGTMAVITFLRQLTEQHGFWRASDRQWISLERIQFVGACNPPTDVGRKPLSPRFLRHTPLILVDFPGPESLKQIYGTFNRAMLRKTVNLKNSWEPLTNAMVDFYTKSQQHFTSDMQPHYIYSPRELTRWKYALNEALEPLETQEDLIRLWSHEAFRLFQDRLVHPHEKEWCDKLVDEVAAKHFLGFDDKALERPIMFSNYLHRVYQSVEREELRKHIQGKLKVFNEEELSVPLVVFDDVLDHILRIDRVLRQPLGHLLLVGASGVGKTTLTRFVSWVNNLSVHQIKAGRDYSISDFDNDLRDVMKRAGVKQEKITFIFDESNVLGPAFLEKMNALLASGEIPGLFEGDEYMALINQIKEAQMKENKMIDTEEQLYKNFITGVQRNLHVVFTMNPANPDFSNRTASSPALFNRCVIDWFGDWNSGALYQVAKEFTLSIDPPDNAFIKKPNHDNPEWKHDILVKSLVYIQNTVVELNRRLSKSAKRFNYITPRDFLDFISHFVELHNEKKSKLEEQQLHLNVGLNKLKETEIQVLDMQKSLDSKKIELESKERQAGEKLQSILQEQKGAEKKKEDSIKLSIDAEKKAKEINERETVVNAELDQALPALEKAKQSVNGIKKDDLNQIRSFAKPPPLVMLTMEAVICTITQQAKALDWTYVKQQMSGMNFIKSVLEFKTDDLPLAVKQFVQKNYISKPEWNVEKIQYSSSSCGPLAQWVESQLKYADISQKVQPLRTEVTRLKIEGESIFKLKREYDEEVIEAENKINQLQQEYAVLISEKENIKSEMLKVAEKVNRSCNLLNNLSSERVRWDDSSQSFKFQLATMVGDVLLSSAFLSYIGFFDHFYRKVITNTWKDYINNVAQIQIRQELSIIEFLSKPSERLNWQSHTLPSDDLCLENAIILQRFHRYPLVVDPSGQALSFLASHLKDKKLARTSFSDESFLKTLETCLRFGCPLLVQDVEKIDPILNSVLNKEVYKTGGRVLIRVGNQEIDFAASFNIFMITRDSSAIFTPDLCSRVTFVNFTVTQSSLQEQCLNIYLRNESAETEEKRLNLMKLQGEYIVKLRDLEDSLLDSLNNVRGSILEDESVIQTLEKLKKESEIVMIEMKKADTIMAEVLAVTQTYIPLASSTSKIFFSLQSLSNIHYLYQFSLAFFMDTIYYVLNKNENLTKIPKVEVDKRRNTIFNEFFREIYRRMNQALLFEDKLVFAFKLVEVKLGDGNMGKQYHQLFKAPGLVEVTLSQSFMQGKLKPSQLRGLEELNSTDRYNGLIQHIQSHEDVWINFYNCENPEDDVPEGWENKQLEQREEQVNWSEDPIQFQKKFEQFLQKLTILKVVRPDRFQFAAQRFINTILGERVMDEVPVDMKLVVEKECTSRTPILMCSAPGFDPSFKVEQLSKEMGVRLVSVAIGSQEGFDQADAAVNQGVKSGTWVMLKNVHLATSWLNDLEKKLFRLQPHQNFRIFLTMEFNPKVPATLIRQSYKLVFEPPDGIKASLTRTYKNVLSQARSDKAPAERARLHFLLAWLHAVIIERLRFTPIGWTKAYEFNEADQRCSLDLIDEYVDALGARANIDPAKLPWDAFRVILCQNLYGGKVDNEYDSKILQSLIDQFFQEKSFDPNHELFVTAEGRESFKVPEAVKYNQFLQWVENLPKVENPEWSGLPSNVERVQREQQTNKMISRVQSLSQETEEEITSIELPQQQQKKGQQNQKSEQVQWLQEVLERVQRYGSILPLELHKLDRSGDQMNDPMYRFLERETTVVDSLLRQIRKNLVELKNLAEGKVSATNVLRALARDVHADIVPTQWQKYTVMSLGLNDWISDFKKRLEQFQKLSETPNYCKQFEIFFQEQIGVWFGGLLFPEAFLTATRQFVAQNNQWSLEELELTLVPANQEMDQNCFILNGLSMEGANLNNIDLSVTITQDISVPLQPLTLKWHRPSDGKGQVQDDEIMLPVYLNKSRKNLVFSMKVKMGKSSSQTLYQKGLALILFN